LSKTILVTGGAGYIGSHTCKALASDGYLPVTFDNLIYGHEWAVQWGPLVQGDLLDSHQLDRVFEQYQPMAVVHFAAFAYVGESVADPGKYYRNNVAGTIALLNAMQRHGCRQIVFSSTCATYGRPSKLPIDEASPQVPINPYGRSKLMIEQMLADYRRAHQINYMALRYFNAAGADPEAQIGEDHDPETHLIPLTIQAAESRGPELAVYGTDYDTADGSAVRDYVHVSDLATAHLLALRHLKAGNPSGALNLGTGEGYSVRQVVNAVERCGGRPVPIVASPRRAGDPPILIADPQQAQKVLGWHPQHSDLATIIQTAIEWSKRHFS
jgi:UDP-arabinose 4-epimerase